MNVMESILAMAKEVREVKDNAEAALLVQSGNWIIVQAAMQGDDICWVLIRI